MRQWILLSIGLFMAFSVVAQDNPKKELRNANRSLGSYRLDPENNGEDLMEAKKSIEFALTDDEIASEAKSWILKGEIYNEIAAQNAANYVLNPDYQPKVENASLEAFKAFMKASDKAEKNYEIKDCEKGLKETASHLSNYGVTKYSKQDYVHAYEAFEAILQIREFLREQGDNSLLEKEEDYQNQLYMTGLAALNSGNENEAKDYFMKLYEMEYDNPVVYEALFKLKSKTGDDDAMKYLQEGREKFPDDLSLLYAEINYALRNNKLEELIGKLELAMERDPENKSLYSTMGNVYDQLFQKAEEKGMDDKSQEYFDKAKSYYKQALEIDSTYFDAVYSIGALYYNKAASFTQDMKELEDDYSKEGLKKYEKLKSKVFSYFDKSLPYFKKAEMLDPNDINTLIALKEIYARKNEIEVSNEFKQRLEKAQAGDQPNESYFKNQ